MDFDEEFANKIKGQCPIVYDAVIFFLKKIKIQSENHNKSMKAVVWLLVCLVIPIWLIVLDVLIDKI